MLNLGTFLFRDCKALADRVKTRNESTAAYFFDSRTSTHLRTRYIRVEVVGLTSKSAHSYS